MGGRVLRPAAKRGLPSRRCFKDVFEDAFDDSLHLTRARAVPAVRKSDQKPVTAPTIHHNRCKYAKVEMTLFFPAPTAGF